MNSINLRKKSVPNLTRKPYLLKALLEKYLLFAHLQANDKIYWYMKTIIVIPCVIMVPTILFMASSTDNYLWFIGLSMLLFVSNMIVHIAEMKSTIFVPVYHISISIMVLIPFITYLMNP